MTRLSGADRRRSALEAVDEEFAHIRRSWDPKQARVVARILPGEFYVCVDGEYVSTLLGSCIAACVRDPVAGIGGMNHFMLPAPSELGPFDEVCTSARYGTHAMELLITAIQQRGGRRERLEAKLVGGGRMMAGRHDVGRSNIAFAWRYAEAEGMRVVAEDLGGHEARNVRYCPQSGVLQVHRIADAARKDLREREERYLSAIREEEVDGGVEMF